MEETTFCEETPEEVTQNFSVVCWNGRNVEAETNAVFSLLDLWCEFWHDDSPTPTQVDFGKFSEKPPSKNVTRSLNKNNAILKPIVKCEDSWQGLEHYKQQKCENMYPSWSLERQEMLLSQLYKR